MIRRIFSIFGIVAIVAFFLPWLKACGEVETGFQLLILASIKDFAFGSLSSLNTGLLFMLVPLYAVLIAWLVKENNTPFKVVFGFLAFLTFWNIGIWGGLQVNAMLEEWGTELHVHSMTMAKLAGIQLISLIALIVFIFRWVRGGNFNLGWSCAVLIMPIFADLGIAFTIKPIYYGIWIYLFSMIGLFVGSVFSAIKTKT